MQIRRNQYAETTKPEDVPAFAEEDVALRVVRLSHPLGERHPSLLAAADRYSRRGFLVVVVPARVAA